MTDPRYNPPHSAIIRARCDAAFFEDPLSRFAWMWLSCLVLHGSTQIKHLYISAGHNFVGHHEKVPSTYEMREVGEITCLAGRGIEGDRFLDFKPEYKGQITFFASEIYEELCAMMDVWDKPPSVFRRNVITSGFDLNDWIGREFDIQGVRFLGMAECSPCYWMDRAFAPGAEKRLKGHGGLRAKILSTGRLASERNDVARIGIPSSVDNK